VGALLYTLIGGEVVEIVSISLVFEMAKPGFFFIKSGFDKHNRPFRNF
jgi:hypothetical protein